MAEQNYNNHRKFYPPHHFIFLPMLGFFQVFGIYKAFTETDSLVWILFSIVIFLIFYLTFMVRQHYALGNQDRIIRLEFRQRYYELFQKRSDDVVERLNFDQIAALRFAGDEEFKILLQQALNENISGKTLKKSIKNWRPDTHRV